MWYALAAIAGGSLGAVLMALVVMAGREDPEGFRRQAPTCQECSRPFFVLSSHREPRPIFCPECRLKLGAR